MKARGRGHGAGLALHQLDDHAAGLLGDRLFERLHVVERCEAHAGDERLERRAVGRVPGRRQREARAPVEAAREGDQVAALPALCGSTRAAELERRLDALRARVGEEHRS
jgi:hypothetical protein